MIVLHANEEQYQKLNDYKFSFSVLDFTKDADDKWIVGLGVLDDVNFFEIKEELEQLERIEYNPKHGFLGY